MKHDQITASPPVVLGVSRVEAAAAVGVCANTFDALVKDGAMPQPIQIAGRRLVWDVDELRASFKALPRRGEGLNSWSDV